VPVRILFIRLSSFGDVVFALPAAKALKTARPDVSLAWAIEGPLAPLVAGAQYVDEVLETDTRAWRRSPFARKTREETGDFLRRGREQAFDLVIDAQGLFKSALVAALVPAPRKVGFGWRTATERINCLVTSERVEAADRPHVLDRMLALAEHVTGKTGFERVPDVRHLVEKEDPAVDSWLERNGNRPFAMLQPFSSKVNKEWGADDVTAFAEALVAKGVQPVLRWGPGEESRAQELINHSKKSPGGLSSSVVSLVLAPPTSPASSARLSARAALFVGADSGPTHLAAAAGTPTLALFGPTSPERFGPVGPHTNVLRGAGGEYNRGPLRSAKWPVHDVLDAALSLLH
jgi:heptosyltransferase-1